MTTWTYPTIAPLSRALESELRRRVDRKTKPIGSLGQLEELALHIGLIQGTAEPELRGPVVLVFAGDHGLAAEGVSPYPSDVTVQMVHNFLAGGAAINVFARLHGLSLRVVDAGVAAIIEAHPALLSRKIRAGTRNALHEPALTLAEVKRCFEEGEAIVAELAAEGTNALLFGEMGIGNTSAAALLVSTLLGLPLERCVGRGAGHDEAGFAHKRDVLLRVQKRHAEARDPISALGAFGGCEIAMMTGAMLAAAARRMVIVNDGFITTAALLTASKLQPQVLDYVVWAHRSAESGHGAVLDALGARPLLDLGLRLGEGTGAALAWPLLVAATAFLREMATFASAGVSERGETLV